MRLHGAAHDFKVLRRRVRKTNEEQARQAFDAHGLERELAAIELLSHVLVVDELAASIIGPLVIRAD